MLSYLCYKTYKKCFIIFCDSHNLSDDPRLPLTFKLKMNRCHLCEYVSFSKFDFLYTVF